MLSLKRVKDCCACSETMNLQTLESENVANIKRQYQCANIYCKSLIFRGYSILQFSP